MTLQNKILTCTNSGLGDCILMNGANRYLSTIFDEVAVLTIASHNTYRQIKHMYSDNPKIRVIGEPPARSFVRGNRKISVWAKRHKDWHIRTFWWPPREWSSHATTYGLSPTSNCWPELFYTYVVGGGDAKQANYHRRYEDFYVPRDPEREQKLINELDLPYTGYALVIDRGAAERFHFNINPPSSFPIFKPHYRSDLFDQYTIFDWMGVIEKAKEVYTIDTSWFHLMKQMKLDKPKFFINNIARPMKCVVESHYLNDSWDHGWRL